MNTCCSRVAQFVPSTVGLRYRGISFLNSKYGLKVLVQLIIRSRSSSLARYDDNDNDDIIIMMQLIYVCIYIYIYTYYVCMTTIIILSMQY